MPIDPNGTTIASILAKLDNGLRTDMDDISRQLGTACDIWQKSVVPLSGVWKQTVQVTRDDKVRKLARKERKACNDGACLEGDLAVEKEAKSRYALTKSDFRSKVKTAQGIYTPKEVKNTISQAKRWAESAEGELVITGEAVSIVGELFQKRSATGTASASAESRSCLDGCHARRNERSMRRGKGDLSMPYLQLDLMSMCIVVPVYKIPCSSSLLISNLPHCDHNCRLIPSVTTC
jgi:hypothetical protein